MTQLGDQKPVGITINSLTSVSLTPPLVLWCISKSSRLCEYFQPDSKYSINVLTKDQKPLSLYYARSGDRRADPSHTDFSNPVAPSIKDSAATFFCQLESIHEGGDHYIILGNVIEYKAGNSKQPLVFHRGQFQSIAA